MAAATGAAATGAAAMAAAIRPNRTTRHPARRRGAASFVAMLDRVGSVSACARGGSRRSVGGGRLAGTIVRTTGAPLAVRPEAAVQGGGIERSVALLRALGDDERA